MKKEKVNINEFLKEIYYRLLHAGYEEFSLKSEDLLSYVPQMEEIVRKNNIDLGDLFVKSPAETYDNYKDYLISTFVHEDVGYLNDNCDSLILVNNPYSVKKCIAEAYLDHVKRKTNFHRAAGFCALEVVAAIENKESSNSKTKKAH